MQEITRELIDEILERTHDAVVAVDVSGRVLVFNSAAEKITGFKSSDVLGVRSDDLLDMLGLKKTLTTLEEEINQKEKVGTTKIAITRCPIRGSDGAILGALAVFRDVTEFSNLTEEITNLRQVRTFLSAVINATQDAIQVVDANGIGILINPAYTRITGLTEKDVIGKPAAVDIAEGQSMHMQVLKTRKSVSNVFMKVGPMRRQVVVTVDPIIVDGQLLGSVGVAHDVSEIVRLTEELDRMKKIVRQLEAKYTFDEVVAISPLMIQAVEQAKRVAQTSVTVLLRGESGTGKELFAHAIHSASPRRHQPFVRVNCAALPKSILESELFGYVDGAFTGARKGGKRGLFEEANGGTLFLDEVGVMDLSLQASLLRVLQEKEILRVGDSKPIPVDVRVIAATNVSLEQLLVEGRFREDLYYRLNVIPIFIPPLRQRTEDLPELCQHLLRKLNQEYGRSVKGVDEKVMEVFRRYRWPGNVRELENVLGRAMINMRYQEDVIRLEHLPPLVPSFRGPEYLIADGAGDPGKNPEPLKVSLLKAEKEAIQRALAACSYNKTKAARALGISVRSLYNKMARHGLGCERGHDQQGSRPV